MDPRASTIGFSLFFLAAWSPAGQAWAAPPSRANAYALLVASNHGGAGQKKLRYAHQDARRMAEVLVQVGGYARANVLTILDPEREAITGAIDRIGGRLRVHADRGEPSLFIFYYSGHARARALNIGREELALSDLRQRLVSLPTTMTVAILDACQSGAISRVKGAAPAADFSYNSINDLKTTGVAVMASSSGSELSQEAESLQASYFTHHLVVGLRGAADEDTDGGVTLSEAYRYAYNRTLVATAATAVGKQHVTLETQLRGKGEMVLTYPSRARSTLLLPRDLAGQVLVHQRQKRTVVAELSKVAGRPLALALPGGSYVALVHESGKRLRCPLSLPEKGQLVLSTRRCQPLAAAAEPTAGIKGQPGPWRETWGLEVGFGALRPTRDAYTDTLENFRFDEQWRLFNNLATFSVSLSRRVAPYLSVVVGWSMLDGGLHKREAFDENNERRNQWFEWSSHAIGVYARTSLPLLRGWLVPYLQAGGGLAWGTTEYRDNLQASMVVDDQLHWGFHLGVAAGLQLMPWRHLGCFGQLAYTYAPVIDNDIGQTHNSGGPTLIIGLRGAL